MRALVLYLLGLVFLVSPIVFAQDKEERKRFRYNWLRDPRAIYLKDRWPKPSINQRLEVLNYTIIKHKAFGFRTIEDVPSFSNVDAASYQHWQYRYSFQANYRYYHWFLHAEILHGRDRSFLPNGAILNEDRLLEGSLRPEFHYRILFFSLGIGYKWHFGDNHPNYAHYLNRDALYLMVGIDQRVFHLPLHVLAYGNTSLNKFSFDRDSIYTVSGGMRFELAYYIYFTLLYKSSWYPSNDIRDNIIDMQLDYRWTPGFSIHARYSRLIITRDRTPFNELSFAASYRINLQKR